MRLSEVGMSGFAWRRSERNWETLAPRTWSCRLQMQTYATILASLDARLALVLYTLLLVAAAASIALCWLRLLPSEREPFARTDLEQPKPPRDAFAIFLLA